MIERAKEAFPDAQVFATTLREELSADSHLWGAIMWERQGGWQVGPREITVLDRIGGGDGVVGGLLYALLASIKAWSPLRTPPTSGPSFSFRG
jgi:2-dehydro-3-deoxygluconokinase